MFNWLKNNIVKLGRLKIMQNEHVRLRDEYSRKV